MTKESIKGIKSPRLKRYVKTLYCYLQRGRDLNIESISFFKGYEKAIDDAAKLAVDTFSDNVLIKLINSIFEVMDNQYPLIKDKEIRIAEVVRIIKEVADEEH